jgi:hypothetical protein
MYTHTNTHTHTLLSLLPPPHGIDTSTSNSLLKMQTVKLNVTHLKREESVRKEGKL